MGLRKLRTRTGEYIGTRVTWVQTGFVQADGTFTVTNTRNGFSKTYQKRTN